MTTENRSSDPNPSTSDIQPSFVPSRPPPKPKRPIRQLLIGGSIGVAIALASIAFLGDEAPQQRHAGPTYISGDISWRAVDLEWSTMWGSHALDMKVDPVRLRGSSDTTFMVTGALIRSLCGSVLTKLPDPPDGVTRDGIYRLGFHFFEPGGKTITDVLAVPVQNGACVAHDNQVIFDWGYPGPLTGWSPVRYEDQGEDKMTIFFGRRGETEIPYDELDLQLACDALYFESSDKMRDLLADIKELEVRVVKGIVTAVFWAGLFRSQSFQIINGTCHPIGKITEG